MLPNGQTVGDVVNGVENLINALAAINPVAGLGAYVGAALPYGPLDFKNNFRGQANATFLSAAGNFAFGAVIGELFGSGRFGSYVGLSGAGVYATVVGKGGPGLPFIAAPYAADPSARQSVPAGVAALCRK